MSKASPASPPAFDRWRVWGTTVVVGVQPARLLPEVRRIVAEEIAAVDAACSRFSADSELSALNRADGRWVRVGPVLGEALEVALAAAERTHGAVDPTVGRALEVLGYDRDYDEVAAGDPGLPLGGTPRPAGGWRTVGLHPSGRAACVPPGLHLDLGATAKALCADRAAARAARELGVGVIVDIGGDLAVAGPAPAGGWRVGVVEDARRTPPEALETACTVAVSSGGVATSGTTARTWVRGGRRLHHVVDPATGWPAPGVWAMVTVAGSSCVEANTFATAAVVWGEAALFRLPQEGMAARLVRHSGEVIEVGAWPRPSAAHPPVPGRVDRVPPGPGRRGQLLPWPGRTHQESA